MAKVFASIHHFSTFALLILFALIRHKNACPFQVRAFCACIDHVDGVQLNCTAPGRAATNSSGQVGKIGPQQNGGGVIQLMQVLRSSQAHLGLLKVRLDLSNNSINELKAEHSLPRMPKLTDIDLSHNRISAVHKTFFDGVKGTLQTINIGHNIIDEVPASAIRGFRMLMALHLHNNLLHGTLPALSFMNLPVLSLLNLAGNQISAMHRQAFLNVPMLRYLYLSANRLTQIQPFQLSSFERLEMLDLSNNWVEVIENDSFAGLPSLRQLYLGENHIKSIESFAFSQNASIAVLILEQNWLLEVTKDAFRSLRQLQQLSLKSNKIRSVDVAAFQGNPSMVMLDLSRNELIDLAPGTFLSQLNLLLVDLSFNKIVRTPFGAFGRRIATVLLQENPLVCVEQIHMLQQGTGVFIPNNEDVICGKTSTISTTKSTEDSASESPSIDQVEDSTLEEPEEESAFVQQKGTLPPKGSSDELADSVNPTNNGHKAGRMPNIRPIRFGPQQPQQTPAPSIAFSSSSTTRLASPPSNAERMKATLDQNDKLMTIMSAKNAEEMSRFSADENEIAQQINNKMLTSAPNQLNEKTEKSGEEDSAEGEREVSELDKQTATDTIHATIRPLFTHIRSRFCLLDPNYTRHTA
uniref:Leucine-rich repeat-containing protein let-4 n=1 Tax=Globodera pallida TaxID=36090 RepID=A0A183C8D3_GLOPA